MDQDKNSIIPNNNRSNNNNTNMKYSTNSARSNCRHAYPNQEYTDESHKIRLFNELNARKNPFAELIRESLLTNPREFELPEDYIPDIQFPGTSKRSTSHQTTISTVGAYPPSSSALSTSSTTREARYTSYSVKRTQEFDRNNLPLILRTCYVCRKGCRKAPLIHCDYCPLVYHADCVDPPLTMLPNTRWMCPNHVEPIAEEKLLTSSSFCERVKLWNHFSKPIDHELIKISFLDKVHIDSKQPPTGTQTDYVGFLKLACRVPKRIKKEYIRYIREIEKYNGDSGSEEGSPRPTDHTQASYPIPSTSVGIGTDISPPKSATYSQHFGSKNHLPFATTVNKEPKQKERREKEHESLLDIALNYMIESSKVLEVYGQRQDHEFEQNHCNKNGDKTSLI